MKFGRFKASFGKRKGKSNDACRQASSGVSELKFSPSFETDFVNWRAAIGARSVCS